MVLVVKGKYLNKFKKWGQKIRRWVFWIPVFSLIIGLAITTLVYFYLKQKEIDSQKVSAFQSARETINQIDLELSNSLLRIQAYEDYLSQRPSSYLQNYVKQALNYTLFQRLTILQEINAKETKLKVISIITRPQSDLPPPSYSKQVRSKEIVKAVKYLKKNSSYHKSILYDWEEFPRFSIILRSKVNPQLFFVFTTPLIAIFDKVILHSDDSLVVQDQSSREAWLVPSSKRIQKINFPAKIQNRHLFSFNFDQGLPQSGLAINFSFNYAQSSSNFFSAANIAALFCFLLTLMISYLFYILTTMNRAAYRMIINKTYDLEQTTHDLQEALKAKNKFLGKVSHEIRTPLNLILGMIDLSIENNPDVKISSYLRSMKTSGEHLLSMIDDLLDLARAESNDINFQGRKTHLAQFLSDVAKLLNKDCETKNLKLYTFISSYLPSVVICDPNRLRQVLLNLLRNACKYTHQGHIILKVQLLSTRENQAKIRFEIQDTGIGIAKDKLSKVFEAFFQVENTSAFSDGGVGLGLSIVKDIVKKMNGQIHVESEVNTGSIFRVDLDFEVHDKKPWAESYRPANGNIKTLLLLTQDPLLQKSFEPLAFHPFIKLIIPERDQFHRILHDLRNENDTFVILDRETCDINAQDLAKRWTKKFLILVDRLRPANPVIIDNVITHLHKTPFLLSELLLALEMTSRQQLRKVVSNIIPSTPAQQNAIAQRPLSLIVADDDLGNLELYKAYFSKTPWKVSYATNGLEAWNLYLKEKVDLMVVDLRMPLMDGFALIEKIREKEKKDISLEVPIIVVTADLLDYTTEKVKQFSKVNLLTKPLKKFLLFEQINKCLAAPAEEELRTAARSS